MKTSFLEFEKCFEDLKTRNERLKNKIRASELDKNVIESKVAELDENFAKSIDMIVEAYDKHMKSVCPAPELLPVRVFLKVPKRNLTIDVHIPRTHTIRDLRQIIVDYYLARGNPVLDITEGRFLLHQAMHEDSDIIELDSSPIGKVCIIQGSTIFFDGDITVKSDAPKECFTKLFVKGGGLKTNYYHCYTCNSNWICEPCSQSCHALHNTTIAIPNHEPTWACCYCVKKGICKIPNNKNK